MTGPCRATKKAYGFNRDTGRCEGFVYGGKAKKIPETSIVDPEWFIPDPDQDTAKNFIEFQIRISIRILPILFKLISKL